MALHAISGPAQNNHHNTLTAFRHIMNPWKYVSCQISQGCARVSKLYLNISTSLNKCLFPRTYTSTSHMFCKQSDNFTNFILSLSYTLSVAHCHNIILMVAHTNSTFITNLSAAKMVGISHNNLTLWHQGI